MKHRNMSSADVGRWFAAIAAIVLIVFVSVRFFANSELETVENAVQMKIDEITGRVKLNKKITREDYEELVEYLSDTGILYDLDLSIGLYTVNPDTFAQLSWDDFVEMMAKEPVYSDFETICPIEDIKCDLVGKELRIETCAAHVHTSACYKGHNHQASGCTFDGKNWSCGITDNDVTPICSKVIVNATWNQNQTIASGHGKILSEGGSFDNRIYVEYLDGSTNIVTARVLSFDDTSEGARNVTMLYNAYYGTAFNNFKTTRTFTVNVTVEADQMVCPICGTKYDCNAEGTNPGCPKCSRQIDYIYTELSDVYGRFGEMTDLDGLMVKAVYADGHEEPVSSYTSDFDKMRAGLQNITISLDGYSSFTYTENGIPKNVVFSDNHRETTITVHLERYYTCPDCRHEYKGDMYGNDAGCPYCNNRCTDIRVVPVKSDYEQGEPLELVVYASYKAGDIVLAEGEWYSNYDAWRIGEQEVRIFFDNYSEVITVRVADPNMLVCPMCGNIFDSRTDASCPVCAAELVGIDAEAVPTIYSYGEEIMLTVWAEYRSGNRVLLTSGYDVLDYDEYKTTGPQTVTIEYKGFTDTVTVTVNPRAALPSGIVICPNGHYYELGPDGTDGGCPYCAGEAGIAPGRADHYAEMIYNAEIIGTLYSAGFYELHEGDTFTITVTQKSEGTANRLGRLMIASRVNKTYFTSGAVIGR